MSEVTTVELSANAAAGFPGFSAQMERVSVILGANGAGKSRLLRLIRDEAGAIFGGGHPVAYVEGGRVVRPPQSVALDRNRINNFRSIEQASATHKQQKRQDLAARTEHMFVLLDRMGEAEKIEHSDASEAWRRSGQQGDMPVRPIPPLDRLFDLFGQVFPQIEISSSDRDKNIQCRKSENTYPPEHLSDGERQVLVILADLAILGEDDAIVLVDEPELNLNPQLACRIWDLIEATRPKSRFIYGTHSLAFAMRGNVDSVFVLRGGQEDPVAVANPADVDPHEMRAFLGSIPAILAAPAALAVEGDDSSLDALFFEWVTSMESLVVAPVGNSSNVVSSAERTGVWEKLAPSVALAGVIDRDFRPDVVIDDCSSDVVVPLKYHEVESYLCAPELVVMGSERLGLVDPLPDIQAVNDIIFDELKNERLRIASLRTFERTKVHLSVGVKKKELLAATGSDEVEALLLASARDQLEVAEKELDQANVAAVFAEELALVDSVIADQDTPRALALVPGKHLLARVFQLTGCRSQSHFARAVTKHATPDEVAAVAALQGSLQDALGAAEATSEEVLPDVVTIGIASEGEGDSSDQLGAGSGGAS